MSSIERLATLPREWMSRFRYRWIWYRRIRPAAERLRRRGAADLRGSASDDQDSWYTTVEPSRPNIVQLEIGDVGNALSAHWKTTGRGELADAADAVGHLVDASKAREEVGGEVSADVYAMY